MQVKDFVIKFGEEAKKYIAYYENFKELKGEQRKNRVIDVLTEWLERTIITLPINPVIRFILKKAIIAALPYIVQVVFNLIESRIEGITK